MNYIGIDIGDGESCVCVLPAVSNIDPRPITITGKKSFLSVIAQNQEGNYVIGSDALGLGAAKGFSVRFKSRFLPDTENAREDMKIFLKCIHDTLEENKHLECEHKITIGCPAGWNDKARSDYLALIKEAGFENARLVSESRGAFLYAKYTQSIQMDPTLIEDSALVIDIGSSTLDFAYVLGGKETNVGTFGDVYLGGGAIDDALLRTAVSLSSRKNEILSIFENAPEWYNYCLLKARNIKEEYFTRQSTGEKNIRCHELVNIMYDEPISLDIKADDILIWREINAPIKALDGNSFYKILQNALNTAKKNTEQNPPKLVLLTGGASRMKFFQDMCKEQFLGSQFIICDEPDVSIAKGLAYSARLDENILAFNKEIKEFLDGDKIQNAVESQMESLIESLAKSMTDISYGEAENCYEKWQKGEYKTLNDLSNAISKQAENKLKSEEGKIAIANSIADEMDNIVGILQPEIDDICRKHNIGENRMHLEKITDVLNNGDWTDVPIDLDFILNVITIAVGAAVFIIMAIIPGTQILDLLLAIVSAIAVRFGFKIPVGDAIKNFNIPNPLRRGISPDKVINSNFYGQIYSAFLDNLKKDVKFQKDITQSIEKGLQNYISKLAKRTEIAITSGDEANV